MLKHNGIHTFLRAFSITLIILGLAAAWAGLQIAGILASNQKAEKTYQELQSTFQTESECDFPQVDWTKLKTQYPNVVGWLYCPDTEIDYPLVQAENNDFYLNHLANGVADRHGAIFIDCRNNSNFADGNTLVYGHNMNDGSMFHSLLNWGNADYFMNHPVLYLLTETQNYTVCLYNVCVVDTDSPVYDVTCGGDKAAWLDQCSHKSWVVANFVPTADMPIITFSTCSNHTNRLVLQGVLCKLN